MESTTMKKTYINPEMEIVKIATQQMLATSDPESGTLFDPDQDTDTMDGRYSGGDF